MDTKEPYQFDSEITRCVFNPHIESVNEPKTSSLRFALVFSGLMLGIIMAALDQTIVTTALGQISAEFNATNDISWVGSAYLLTMSGFQPMYGVFADIIGHKNVYLVAVCIFMFGSVLCGLSSSMLMLIFCRAIQGIGGAGIITIVLIIITDVVSVRDRAKYQGVLGVAIGGSTIIGPLIGGLLADANSWRWAFYMNVFIGIPAIALIVIFFHSDLYVNHRQCTLPLSQSLRRVDYGSVLLLMPGVICILMALQFGGEMLSWNSPLVLTLFFAGGLILLLFVLSEIYVIKHNPVMPRRFMTCRTTVAVFAGQFLSNAADYALLFFAPLHFQVILGDTGLQSALELIPLLLGGVVGGLVSGILISKLGYYRIYLWTGGVLSLIGTALFTTSTVDSGAMRLHIYLAIMGLGVGLCKQSYVVAGQAAVPEEDLTLITSHGQFFRILGGGVGISIAGTIFRYNVALGLKDIMEKFHIELSFQNINVIKHLPKVLKYQVQTVAVQSMDKVYVFSAITAGIVLLVLIFIKHFDVWTLEDEERDRKRLGKSSSLPSTNGLQ